MGGCVYRTKDGECDLYSEGGKFHAWCDFENCNEKHPSNADRIRGMSNGELAEWLDHHVSCSRCPLYEKCIFYKTCNENLQAWLKEEASE